MELFTILATVLSAVIGAVTVATANKQNMENANEQLSNQQTFSHEEAISANERAQQNYWETQSPQSRVQQYKEAGLSTGLMYGGAAAGGINSSPMASTPSANLPVMNPILNGGLNDVFENMKKMTERENISEDTEKKKQEVENLKSTIEVNNATIEKIAAENGLTNVLTANSKMDGILKEIEIEVSKATKEARIETITAQLQKLKNEGEKLLKEIEGIEIDNENKQAIYNATLQKMTAEISLTWKQVVKTEAETALVQQQSLLVNEQSKNTYVERQKTWKEIENYRHLIGKVDAEIELIQQQTETTKIEQVNTKMDRVTKVLGWMQQLSGIQNDMNSRFNNTVRTAGNLF